MFWLTQFYANWLFNVSSASLDQKLIKTHAFENVDNSMKSTKYEIKMVKI